MRGVDGWLKIGALDNFDASLLGVNVPLTSWPFACTDTSESVVAVEFKSGPYLVYSSQGY